MSVTFLPSEIEALLARPVRARVGAEERAAFASRRVVVTGAGGSIGSELARELARAGCAALALVDHSELGLFNIERDLAARAPGQPVVASLTDVTHRAAMARVCRDIAPQVVFHAAAYKHVTMAERAPASAAAVNVLGAVHAALAAEAAGARFVLISSDKAADPRSVMGATKRLAERVILAMASAAFHPIVVRFGNVLGSSGSVLPLMRERIRGGRPVLLTDPEATRYFMTVGEAVALVMRAHMTGRGGEILWLEMGRPIEMRDLTTRLISLEQAAGYPPVPIEIIGLRPGEKKTETLADPRLRFERSVDRRIRVAREAPMARKAAEQVIARLRRAWLRADDDAVLNTLARHVEGYVPSDEARAQGPPSRHRRYGEAGPPSRHRRFGEPGRRGAAA